MIKQGNGTELADQQPHPLRKGFFRFPEAQHPHAAVAAIRFDELALVQPGVCEVAKKIATWQTPSELFEGTRI